MKPPCKFPRCRATESIPPRTLTVDSAPRADTGSGWINYPNILGAQSQIEWRGKRYSILGDAKTYNGSRRTAHVDYVMVRR
jgi:hypothetical protein